MVSDGVAICRAKPFDAASFPSAAKESGLLNWEISFRMVSPEVVSSRRSVGENPETSRAIDRRSQRR